MSDLARNTRQNFNNIPDFSNILKTPSADILKSASSQLKLALDSVNSMPVPSALSQIEQLRKGFERGMNSSLPKFDSFKPPYHEENQALLRKQNQIKTEIETDPSKIINSPDSLLKNLSDQKILNQKPMEIGYAYNSRHILDSLEQKQILLNSYKVNPEPDSRYLKFFDGLLGENHILQAKPIIEHFKDLKETFNDLYQFIAWKVTSDYSGYFLSQIEGIDEEYPKSNFRIKTVCLAQNVNFKTKMIVFNLKYYAGYFVDSEKSESFVLLDENEEFNELTNDFEFIDDNSKYFIENHISNYFENYPDKLPKNINEFEATKAILEIINDLESKTISFDENKLNLINKTKDLEYYVRSSHRLKKNGCVAGFRFKLSVSVEDAGKEFVLSRKEEVKEISFIPPQNIVIDGKEIKLSKGEYLNLFYFISLESDYKNEWVHLDDFIDHAHDNQIDEIGNSNRDKLRSSFVRLKDKFVKNGLENIVLIDGFKVRINSVAKI